MSGGVIGQSQAPVISAGVISAGVVGDSGQSLRYVYTFDGSSTFAVMGTGWRPLGLDYSMMVTMTPTGELGPNRGMILSETAATGFRISTATIQSRNLEQDNVTAANNGISPWEQGRTETISMIARMGFWDVESGTQTDTIAETLQSYSMNPIKGIGARPDGTQKWEGQLRDIRLMDDAPLQDRNVQAGDNANQFTLKTPIVIPDGDAWSIKISVRRFDFAATNDGVTRLFGDSTGATRLLMFDTLHATNPNKLDFRYNSTSQGGFDNALQYWPEGSHFELEIYKDAGEFVNARLNGEQLTKTGGANTEGDLIIDQLAFAANAGRLSNGCAIGDVIIQNITTGDSWIYKLGESF